MLLSILIHLVIINLILATTSDNKNTNKYILYDTNPGEGFNLRRDVYMRIAGLVKSLNSDKRNKNPTHNYILVLPPWGRIGYHWGPQENKIKWSEFFNLKAINLDTPVLEFEDFLDRQNYIDHVWYLQNYKEGWNGKWEEKLDISECNDQPQYTSIKNSGNISYKSWFFGYSNSISAKNFVCMSVQGHAKILKDHIFNFMRMDVDVASSSPSPSSPTPSTTNSILIDRAETILHDKFGQYDFWNTRRSMQFSKKLYDYAVKFQLENGLLQDQNPLSSVAYLGKDWQLLSAKPKSPIGNNFISAHLRRRDFIRMSSHRNIPTIEEACEILLKLANQEKVSTIFIATDGDHSEIQKIRKNIEFSENGKTKNKISVVLFTPTSKEINDNHLHKGSIAIIDQIICSHSKYFIGTEESTFSFRIHDERIINGFSEASTLNHFCSQGKEECGSPSSWPVIYNKKDEMY